jgi:DNA-directed RNA polymerase subunit RPC12/RpoP
MKQCPVCKMMMWMDSDGYWNCSNCNVRLLLVKGDKINRRCPNCSLRLVFKQKVSKGFLFECPKCSFEIVFK